MKYVNQKFTMPTCEKPLSQLEYDLRVGNITQEQYDKLMDQPREAFERKTFESGGVNCS